MQTIVSQLVVKVRLFNGDFSHILTIFIDDDSKQQIFIRSCTYETLNQGCGLNTVTVQNFTLSNACVATCNSPDCNQQVLQVSGDGHGSGSIGFDHTSATVSLLMASLSIVIG